MTAGDLTALIKGNPLKVGCGVIALLLGPTIYVLSGQITDAEALLTQKSGEAEHLAQNVKEGSQLAEQVTALEGASKKIEDRLVHADQLANNLQYFYQLVSETQVELIDVRQTTSGAGTRSPRKPGFTSVGFEVSVKGTYPMLLNWLRRIERGAHYCRVTSFAVASPGVDRAGQLTFTLSLELLGQP